MIIKKTIPCKFKLHKKMNRLRFPWVLDNEYKEKDSLQIQVTQGDERVIISMVNRQ